MSPKRQSLTDAQEAIIGDLDDVAEHVAWEFDADNYRGVGTCGFAHISGINGNGSFVKRVKSLSDMAHPMVEEPRGRDGYRIRVGSLELSLRKDSYRGGYRLSVINTAQYISGPESQRLDVRERLHSLVLGRLRYHGYCDDARVRSRMD